jgi:type I restriction enzyme S subunit
MTKIELGREHLKLVTAILALRINRGEVWVFGSRINKNAAKIFSDLDLAFVGMPPLTINEIGILQEDFSESNLPIRVDICNYSDLPDAIKRDVSNHHAVLLRACEKPPSTGP